MVDGSAAHVFVTPLWRAGYSDGAVEFIIIDVSSFEVFGGKFMVTHTLVKLLSQYPGSLICFLLEITCCGLKDSLLVQREES